jgi:Domain of unknown function DUF29
MTISGKAMNTGTLYDEDFVVWTERQASELRRLARDGSNLPIDWENVAEEIESLGKRDRRSVYSRVYQILRHLLKLKFSSVEEPRGGWQGEISEQRNRLEKVLRDSSSLTPMIAGIVKDQWQSALERAELDLAKHGESVSLHHLASAEPLFNTVEIVSDGWYPEPDAPTGWSVSAQAQTDS